MSASGVKNSHGKARNTRNRRLGHEPLERRDLLASQGLDAAFGHGGIVEQSFAGATAAFASAVAIQPDGKIVVGGGTANPSLPPATLNFDGGYVLTRYNPDGTLDPSFGVNGTVTTYPAQNHGPGVSHIVVERDGKLLVTGLAGLLRYNADGSVDTTFGVGGLVSTGSGSWVAVQSDGKILTSSSELNRFNPDGTPDQTFGVNGFVIAPALQFVIAPDGKIIATAGDKIQRLTSDGQADNTFGNGGSVTPPLHDGLAHHGAAIVLKPDGKIDWVGSVIISDQTGWREVIEVVQYNADGTIDSAYGKQGQTIISQDPITNPSDAVLEADGKLVIVGRSGLFSSGFAPGNFVGDIFTARLNSDGSLDPTWGAGGVSKIVVGGSAEAFAAAQTANGQIVLAGDAGPVNANPQSHAFLTVQLSGDFNQAFVQHAFVDLLSRNADPGAVTYFTTQLEHSALSRTQLVLTIQASEEYRENTVRQVYSQYLSRAVDPTGLASWTALLASGGTREQLEAKILASDEFYRQICGGDRDVFLEKLYQLVLHRPVDPSGRQAFEQELLQGESRANVVAAVLNSPENEQKTVDSLYIELLSRPADAGGLAFFRSELAAGASIEPIMAQLAASEEYFSGLS